MINEVWENIKDTVFEKFLCLKLIADGNIAQNPQDWSQNVKFLILAQLDKFLNDTCLNNSLDFGFGCFTSVWNGPEWID